MVTTFVRKRFLPLAVMAVTLSTIAALSVVGTTQAQEVRAASSREVPSGWSWTNYGPELLSVSCATPTTCVAVGQGGAVLRSPNTSEVPLAWTFVDLRKDPATPDSPVDLVGVTCSTTSCLAVSSPLTPTVASGSWVYRSTDGGVTWAAVQQLPAVGTRKTSIGSAITCAADPAATSATRACVIAGVDGGIWRSTDDGQSWTGIPLAATAPATASFDKIACPTPALCVVAGGDDSPSSAIVRGTTVKMLATPVGIDKRFAALACDGPTRCVSTGAQGNVSVMTLDADPAWGAAHALRRNPLQAGIAVKALACPVVNTCIGLDLDGGLLRTDALADPAATWSMRPVQPVISALTCITASCVGVGKGAAWYTSADLGSAFTRVNEVAGFDLAVCSGAVSPACLAGGKENIGRSITGGTLWTLPIADRGAFNTKAMRCTTSLACSLFGQFEVLATNDMDVFRPRFGPVQSAAGSESQTCVTDTVCVAVNESVVFTTFDGGRTQWSSNQFPKVRPSGITCLPGRTDPVTCFVANKFNILIGTMQQDPATGLPHWLWRYTNADADEEITAIGCSPDGRQCAAVGKAGEILTTADASLLNWSQQTIPANVPVDELPDYTSIDCSAPGFCMAGGKHGAASIVTSTLTFFADYSYDQIGDLRAAPGVSGFGCATVNRCIAVGSTVLLGLRNPPAATPVR
ncbi:MAG: sialidase family protein [Candidatus Nanopelagicales bacterium]|nr:sialidase family protein [Candidatus Nanopelagicales bacterium]